MPEKTASVPRRRRVIGTENNGVALLRNRRRVGMVSCVLPADGAAGCSGVQKTAAASPVRRSRRLCDLGVPLDDDDDVSVTVRRPVSE